MTELRRAKPCIKVLTKSDLADPSVTQAWLAHGEGRTNDALSKIEEARAAFGDPKRAADHTPHLLARLAGLDWPDDVRAVIDAWRAELAKPPEQSNGPSSLLTLE